MRACQALTCCTGQRHQWCLNAPVYLMKSSVHTVHTCAIQYGKIIGSIKVGFHWELNTDWSPLLNSALLIPDQQYGLVAHPITVSAFISYRDNMKFRTCYISQSLFEPLVLGIPWLTKPRHWLRIVKWLYIEQSSSCCLSQIKHFQWSGDSFLLVRT